MTVSLQVPISKKVVSAGTVSPSVSWLDASASMVLSVVGSVLSKVPSVAVVCLTVVSGEGASKVTSAVSGRAPRRR